MLNLLKGIKLIHLCAIALLTKLCFSNPSTWQDVFGLVTILCIIQITEGYLICLAEKEKEANGKRKADSPNAVTTGYLQDQLDSVRSDLNKMSLFVGLRKKKDLD